MQIHAIVSPCKFNNSYSYSSAILTIKSHYRVINNNNIWNSNSPKKIENVNNKKEYNKNKKNIYIFNILKKNTKKHQYKDDNNKINHFIIKLNVCIYL